MTGQLLGSYILCNAREVPPTRLLNHGFLALGRCRCLTKHCNERWTSTKHVPARNRLGDESPTGDDIDQKTRNRARANKPIHYAQYTIRRNRKAAVNSRVALLVYGVGFLGKKQKSHINTREMFNVLPKHGSRDLQALKTFDADIFIV